MDDETRFWIAQQVAEIKYDADIKPLFRTGKILAGKKPLTLISDGARNFHAAYKKEFQTHTLPRTKHIRQIRVQGDLNNNKMERLNGEIRDRENTMRDLKKAEIPILKGLRIYHYYVRKHEALGGQTPSERAGIMVEGNNKWKSLIENASVKDVDMT